MSDISHSKFWKSTAIFVLEDDPQDGVDHVDGHRSVLWTISPYARHSVVNSNYYSQINVVRTAEQILGIKPMNQEDRGAQPMYSAFTSHPNYTPYTVQPNQIPLTLGAPGAASTAAVHTAIARRYSHVPAAEMGVYRQWTAWSRHQHVNGPHAVNDSSNPAQLNRLDWYSATGWSRVYPGDLRILAPNQVPGRHRSALDIGTGG